MEGYTRDSLRAMRREALQEKQNHREKGSKFITILIVLLFLGAGGFYIKTTKPEWLPAEWSFEAINEQFKAWKADWNAAFQQEDVLSVQQTVEDALAEQNEKD